MKHLTIIVAFAVSIFLVYFFWPIAGNQFTRDIRIVKDSTNALRVIIEFELKDSAQAFVRFWRASNQSEVKQSSLSSIKKHHTIPVVGIIGDEEYEIQVIGFQNLDTIKSDVFKFTTNPPPRGMLRVVWTKKPSLEFPGYILSQRQARNSGDGVVYMIDNMGQTVWYTKASGLLKFSWFSKMNSIFVLSGDESNPRSAGNRILEFDLFGNLIREFDLTKIQNGIEAHHEIIYAPDGELLTIIYDKKNYPYQSKERTIIGDAIVKLNSDGEITWKWSIFDAIDFSNCKYPIDSLGEWGHANGLSVDTDGHYLLSFRDWNQIWKINSTTGSVIWKLGEGGDFPLTDSALFYGQHAVHKNLRGEYMLFDNGIKSKKSRIVSFDINEELMEAKMKINIELPTSGFSQRRGSAYFIDNYNILVCAAEAGYLYVINLKGEIVGEARTGLPDYYRAIYIPFLNN